jgi:hypothetical protein
MKGILYSLLFLFTLVSCSEKISEDKFIGEWKLEGREHLEGVHVTIKKENDNLIGRLTKLNGNRFVQFFNEINDKWITNIKRASNTRFKISENKVGSSFFFMYNLKTNEDYTVQFIGNDTISFSETVFYTRLK